MDITHIFCNNEILEEYIKERRFMSHINFDFLTESFLFGYGLEDNFSALSDYELEKELNRYREYVISNMGEICREIIFDSRKIAVTIESFWNDQEKNC